ncbi:AAA family ATPase [Variovorax sp. KBS0712]|nr:AAA family ATPase [Variovorax sp. KBS0712]
MVPVQWLWQDWLAQGKVHLLAGAPGQGKTTIALAFAATVSAGGKWPDGRRCAPGNVLVWSGEDDPGDTLIPRLTAMGADLERVHFIDAMRVNGEVMPFDPARDMPDLEKAAQSIGDVRLVIVDPIVSAIAKDGNSNNDVRRGLQPLVDMAWSLSAAVLGISHLSKGTAGRDPNERVNGSVAFTAVVRVVLLAAKIKADDGADKRILVRSKSNIGPDQGGFEYHVEQMEAAPGIETSVVSWGSAIDGTARELLADAEAEQEGQDKTATDEAADSLIRIIGKDMVPSQEATAKMKAEGFSPKVIRNARERIGVIVKRSGFGKEMASYWKLPDTAVVPSEAIHAHSGPHILRASMGTNEESGLVEIARPRASALVAASVFDGQEERI